MQQVFNCPRCGTPNYMSQRFCAGCGAPLAVSCPNCGVYMPSSSPFCSNCGTQVGLGTRQPVKQRKPTSGWAKFGGTLFVLGVLCIIVGPVLIMMKPEAEQSTALIIRYVVIGALGVVIGLPLMFKG